MSWRNWRHLDSLLHEFCFFQQCSGMLLDSSRGGLVAPRSLGVQYLSQFRAGTTVVSLVWFLYGWKRNVFSRIMSSGRSLSQSERERYLMMDRVLSAGMLLLGAMALAESCGVAVQSVLTMGGIGGMYKEGLFMLCKTLDSGLYWIQACTRLCLTRALFLVKPEALPRALPYTLSERFLAKFLSDIDNEWKITNETKFPGLYDPKRCVLLLTYAHPWTGVVEFHSQNLKNRGP